MYGLPLGLLQYPQAQETFFGYYNSLILSIDSTVPTFPKIQQATTQRTI